MLLPRSHARTPLQKWLIVSAAVAILLMCGVGIYWYECYYRGATERALFGTWEQLTDDGRSYYALKPDHTFEVIDPDAPYGPLTFAKGHWNAGGKFVYLRLHVEEPSDRELIVWRIDDISPGELRIRYNPGSPVHSLKRVESDSPHASNPYVRCQGLRSSAWWFVRS